MFFDLVIPPLEQLDMLITLGEGDKALKCMPSIITHGEYYQSSTNTERELYFDLYRICNSIIIFKFWLLLVAMYVWGGEEGCLEMRDVSSRMLHYQEAYWQFIGVVNFSLLHSTIPLLIPFHNSMSHWFKCFIGKTRRGISVMKPKLKYQVYL